MFAKMFAVSLNKFEINKDAKKFLEISGAPSWIDILGKILYFIFKKDTIIEADKDSISFETLSFKFWPFPLGIGPKQDKITIPLSSVTSVNAGWMRPFFPFLCLRQFVVFEIWNGGDRPAISVRFAKSFLNVNDGVKIELKELNKDGDNPFLAKLKEAADILNEATFKAQKVQK
ncbi:MAG: hypothetical protein LBU89_07345 [Fibromonadaceae bacterium]|nr:hypothetical protein [Fibromonadaceae bacterium]